MDSQDDFETRFARWQESYRKHLQLLARFHRWQKGHDQQLALWEQKHGVLHDVRKDLERIKREQAEIRDNLYSGE